MEEKLSSLIREKGLAGGGHHWALLAAPDDTYVLLQGLLRAPHDAHNHEFQLLGVGTTEYGIPCVNMPWAQHLIFRIQQVMQLREQFLFIGRTSSVDKIDQAAAAQGLVIYPLAGSETPLSAGGFAQATSRLVSISEQLAAEELDEYKLEMCLWFLSIALEPPSVLLATYDQSLLICRLPRAIRYYGTSSEVVPGGMMSYISSEEDHSENADRWTLDWPNASRPVALGTANYSGIEAEFPDIRRRSYLGLVLSAAITRSAGHGRDAPVVEYVVRHERDLEAGLHVLSYAPEDEDFHRGDGDHRLRQFAAIIADAIQRRSIGAPPAQGEQEGAFASIMKQAYAAFIPACAMSYPIFKDAPDHVKLVIYGGLVFITVVLHIGSLSNSEARGKLAIRLLSCSAVAAMTFSIASQLSGPTYILVLTALAGVMANLIIMFLRF